MNPGTFDEYLKNRYEDQLRWFSLNAARNRKTYRRFRWSLIFLASITPVIAALNGRSFRMGGEVTIIDVNFIVVCTSAIVAILSSGLKTFRFEEIANSSAKKYEKLRNELYYYEASLSEYGQYDIDKQALFVSRIEATLNEGTDESIAKKTVMFPSARSASDEKAAE